MKYWAVISALLFLLITIFNKKTRVFKIFAEQLKIYRNDKNGKILFWDILSFIFFPIIISIIIAFNLPSETVVKYAGTIITIFSLISTLPLSFLAILIDKILKSKNEKMVAKETFISITVDIIYSLTVIAMVIILAFSPFSKPVCRIIVGIISYLVVKVIMNLLMIIKRVFFIWKE